MSLEKTMNVTCARCGTNHGVTVYDGINTDLAPDIANKIISGQLFQGLCPRCQYITQVNYNVLYHDKKHGAMIWLIHKGSPDYEVSVQNIRANSQAPYAVSRITSDTGAFCEKVLCLEQGRDDRIVELCKVQMMKKPELQNVRPEGIQYTLQGGTEKFVLTDLNGSKTVVDFPVADYGHLKNLFDASAHARSDENFATVDQAWADNIYKTLWNSPFEEKNACAHCGAPVLPNAPFCTQCGNALKSVSVPQKKPQKSGKKLGIVAIILALLLIGSVVGNIIQISVGNENTGEIERLGSYEKWYNQIIDDVGNNYYAHAADHFYASKNIIVMDKDDPGYKLELTAYWEDGGDIYLSYSSDSASVSFDEEKWYDTTTTVTVNPHSVGATVVTFTNSVDASSFKVLIIVTE